MLLLSHSYNRRLEDTLYTVAAAKFAAEQADGVGKNTALLVTWKRRQSDPEKKVAAKFFEEKELEQLRQIWEKYGRPGSKIHLYQSAV